MPCLHDFPLLFVIKNKTISSKLHISCQLGVKGMLTEPFRIQQADPILVYTHLATLFAPLPKKEKRRKTIPRGEKRQLEMEKVLLKQPRESEASTSVLEPQPGHSTYTLCSLYRDP